MMIRRADRMHRSLSPELAVMRGVLASVLRTADRVQRAIDRTGADAGTEELGTLLEQQAVTVRSVVEAVHSISRIARVITHQETALSITPEQVELVVRQLVTLLGRRVPAPVMRQLSVELLELKWPHDLAPEVPIAPDIPYVWELESAGDANDAESGREPVAGAHSAC